ncbi:MAG: HAMP domain-containing sensor histidine kinase [Eubacteriales bacterium]|nr:HAMP domain-containing sensor histidine kinase [Eubacteriales bacterium]
MRNQNGHQNRFALPLLFSAAIFGILLVSVLVAGITVYILAYFHLLPGSGVEKLETAYLLLFMAFISTVVGTVISIFVMKLPLKPITRMITQMNRLAAGDFNARLHFGKPLGSHPSFAEAAESFNKMAEELGNTEMLRADFINNFSHEFKTPIVSIAGFARVLKRGNLTEQQKEEYIDVIEEESLRLAAMATNVLDLTKVENQKILADVTRYNLSEQIRSCVLLLENKWTRKELDFDLEFGEYDVRANEELLKQVWINLLDNAVKFSPAGGTVTVRIVQMQRDVTVSITNSGNEISAEDRERIFNKFYQADKSHAAEGNGIGLAIAKQVTQLHKGSITAENGDGTVTFRVSLPIGCED